MTKRASRRSRTLAGVVVAVLSAFAAARAGPSEVFSAVHAWDLRPGHGPESLRAPTTSTMGSKSPFALPRMQPVPSTTNEFYRGYLARRVSALFSDEKTVNAAEFSNPASRPWTGDPATVQHLENLGIRAIGDAVKQYAVERLGIDRWSLPLTGRSGGAAAVNGAPRVRLRLGISQMAPRADLLIPVTAGRLAVSADARGRLGTTFEPTSSRLRVAAGVDIRQRAATIGLSLRF
jgi:hypothetical protein